MFILYEGQKCYNSKHEQVIKNTYVCKSLNKTESRYTK